MNQHRRTHKRAQAERIYTWFVHRYPAAHRQTFGRQMLQTFQDHYHDSIEMAGESALRFWLGVVSDEGQSLAREHVAALRERTVPMKKVLPVVLMAVGVLLLLLLGLRVWLYPAVLTAPHGGSTGGSSVVGLAILVLVYAAAGAGILRANLSASMPERWVALWRATLVGGIVGGCALGAIATDTLLDPESPISAGAWSVVALAALIGWGLASLSVTRAGGSWRVGVVAALWSGMVSALVGAAGEVTSTLLALPHLAQHELSNPDYLYWHQPDVRSYAIASALAIGMMGLALAPVVASIVGIVGGWLGRVGSRVSLAE